jgi:WhiB family redox-sensing transcriptional regulator
MTALVLAVRDWRSLAACRQADPELFFPDAPADSRQAAEALSFCAGCPVRAECLDFALRHGIADGIWGGLAEDERKRAVSGRAADPLPVPCRAGFHLTLDPRACARCVADRRREESIAREMARDRDQSGRAARRRAESAAA